MCLVGCMKCAGLSHLIQAELDRVGLRDLHVFGRLYNLSRVGTRGRLVARMNWATLGVVLEIKNYI